MKKNIIFGIVIFLCIVLIISFYILYKENILPSGIALFLNLVVIGLFWCVNFIWKKKD